MGSFALIARSNDLHLKMRKKLHNGLRMKMCLNPTLLGTVCMCQIEHKAFFMAGTVHNSFCVFARELPSGCD